MIFFVPFFFMSFLRLPTVQPVYPLLHTPILLHAELQQRYGFEPSLRGVIEMRSQTRALTSDAAPWRVIQDVYGPGPVIPHIDDRCLENCWARGRESIVHYNIFDYINLTVYYLHLSFICIFAFARMTYISLHQGRKCEIIRLTPTQCTKRGNSLSFVDI